MKAVSGGQLSHLHWRDQFLSLKRGRSDMGEGREVSRHRELQESVSCCLPRKEENCPWTSGTPQLEDLSTRPVGVP